MLFSPLRNGADMKKGLKMTLRHRPQLSYNAPKARGLFDPTREFDACGVGFIANMTGEKSHQIVEDALFILENLEHRGAVGADPLAGDGAGHPDPDPA